MYDLIDIYVKMPTHGNWRGYYWAWHDHTRMSKTLVGAVKAFCEREEIDSSSVKAKFAYKEYK